MTLRLYLHPLSSYCQKAVTAFYENDTPFEASLLDGAEPIASEFRALWPIGKFPVLVDGDRLVFDAPTIIEHLDVHHPGPTRFLPDDRAAAIEVRMLDRFFDNYVQTPFQRIVAIALGRDSGDETPLRGQLDTAYAWLERWLAGRE